MFCECIWHGAEAEVDHIPTIFMQCLVCRALILNGYEDLEKHMNWHDKHGHLEKEWLK